MNPRLLIPFGHGGLTGKERIFNYRLSRARRVVENAFGILSTRFRISRSEIEMLSYGVEKNVMAVISTFFYNIASGRTDLRPTQRSAAATERLPSPLIAVRLCRSKVTTSLN